MANWLGQKNSNWFDTSRDPNNGAKNWDLPDGTGPGQNDDVIIAGGIVPPHVFDNGGLRSADIKSLTLSTGSALFIDGQYVNYTGLFIHGDLNNGGTITNQQGFLGFRAASKAASLTGGGAIHMNGGVIGDPLGGAVPGEVLTNVDNLIDGTGAIEMDFVNRAGSLVNGVLIGNAVEAKGGLLTLSGSNFSNSGIFEAADGGTFSITSSIGNAGILHETGSGVFNFQGATLIGGTFLQAGPARAGGFIFTNGNVLDGTISPVDFEAPVEIAAPSYREFKSVLTLRGTIHNPQSIAMDPGASGLQIDASGAILNGGGQITGSGAAVVGAATTNTLTNVDNSFSGALTFSQLTLVNQAAGVINATDMTVPMQLGGESPFGYINPGDVIVRNTGLIEDTGAAGLQLNGAIIDNAGGTIAALGAGAHIDLRATTVKGGALSASGTGSFIRTTDGGSVFDGTASPLNISGQLNIAADEYFGGGATVVGAIHNAGALNVRGNSGRNFTSSKIIIDAAGAQLTGGGQVIIVDQPDFIGGTAGNPLLTTDNIITGVGSVGNGHLTLHNLAAGVIDADQNQQTLSLNTGATIANDGTLEANGGTLVVSDAVTGTGQALITGGGTVRFSAAFAENAVFQGANAGKLRLTQAYAGTISDFTSGDVIDLGNVAYDADATAQLSGTTLHIVENGGDVAQLHFDPASLPTANRFFLGRDANNTLDVLLSPAPLTVAQALAAYSANPNLTPVAVSDSAANVAGGLNALQVETTHGKLTSIALTDAPNGVSISAAQVGADAATLALIAGPYNLSVTAGGGLFIDTLAANVANLTLSGEASAVINGNPRFNAITLGSGNDTVYAGSGGSYIIGNGGNDVLVGGAGPSNTIYALGGDDYLQGGAGSLSDVLVATGSGNDSFYGGSGDNYIVGGTGKNTIVGGGGIESLYGNGSLGDYIVGGSGASNVLVENGNGSAQLWGGPGNNYEVGGAGDDLLVGGASDDFLFGGSGNDTIYGGSGTDYIFPGPGNDFIWTDNIGSPQSTDYIYEGVGTGVDTIADFTPGNGANHDVLVMGAASSAIASFADVQAKAYQAGVYTVLPLSNTDQVYLYNVQPFQLTANDFIFT